MTDLQYTITVDEPPQDADLDTETVDPSNQSTLLNEYCGVYPLSIVSCGWVIAHLATLLILPLEDKYW